MRLSFFESSWMWNFQVKRSSTIRPRYLFFLDSNNVVPFNRSEKRLCRFFRGGLNLINSVLATLRDRRFAHSHSNKISKVKGCRIFNGCIHIVYVDKKYKWSKNRALGNPAKYLLVFGGIILIFKSLASGRKI